jgi:hypothetical protein
MAFDMPKFDKKPSTVPLTGSVESSRYRTVGIYTAIGQTKLNDFYVDEFTGGFIQYVSAPQCEVTGDISVIVWIYCTGLAAAAYIIGQGETDVSGWGFFAFVNNLSFRLNQGGSHTDISAVNGLAFNRWQMLSVTRAGNTGQFYSNGSPITTIGGGGLADPIRSTGKKLLIGINDNEITQKFAGLISRPRIFSESLRADYIARAFEAEKRFYGLA